MIWAVSSLPIFFLGCGVTHKSYQSTEFVPNSMQKSTVPARNINNSNQIYATTCTTLEPSRDGRRAFFGFEIEGDSLVVKGYFYCGQRSPAREAGINVGDKIIKIKGCKVNAASEVIDQINQSDPGGIIFIEVANAGTSFPRPVGVSTISYLPSSGNRPGRDPYNNKCAILKR